MGLQLCASVIAVPGRTSGAAPCGLQCCSPVTAPGLVPGRCRPAWLCRPRRHRTSRTIHRQSCRPGMSWPLKYPRCKQRTVRPTTKQWVVAPPHIGHGCLALTGVPRHCRCTHLPLRLAGGQAGNREDEADVGAGTRRALLPLARGRPLRRPCASLSGRYAPLPCLTTSRRPHTETCRPTDPWWAAAASPCLHGWRTSRSGCKTGAAPAPLTRLRLPPRDQQVQPLAHPGCRRCTFRIRVWPAGVASEELIGDLHIPVASSPVEYHWRLTKQPDYRPAW